MTNCKQLKIPPLEGVNIHKLIHFFKLGNHLFTDRYLEAPHWKSFDLIKNTGYSPMFKHFPEIVKWSEMLQKKKIISKIMTLYISVLAPRQQIPWHVDMDKPGYNKAFITALHTDDSFIELSEHILNNHIHRVVSQETYSLLSSRHMVYRRVIA